MFGKEEAVKEVEAPETEAGTVAVSDGEEVKEYVTLEELCSEDAERDQGEKKLEKYGKWIKYRTRVPLQKMIYAQKRYLSGKKKDSEGFFVYLLTYLLLNPRVDKSQAQLLLKADSKPLLEVIGEAVGEVSELRQEVADDAGES